MHGTDGPSGEGRPLVVAHRGSTTRAGEHTLGAYVDALDEGADGLECDVRLTADGHLVCVHDRRVNRTANGRGLVSTMDLAQLDELDFSFHRRAWADLDDEAPEVDRELHKVLTLERLMQVVADYDRRVELAVETKHPTRYAGLVERRLAELLGRMGWDRPGSPVRVMSFSPVALGRIRKAAPAVEVVMLVERLAGWQVGRNLTPLLGEDWIAGPSVELLRENPRFGSRIRRGGRRMHVWTVNTPQDLDLCVRLGAEAVITDTPGAVKAYLER